jgi:plasmid stabilization system protein ParE
MKKKYEVIWANSAEKELTAIIEYIAEDSPLRACELFTTIRERASSLYTLPDRGRIVPELSDQGINIYRELIVSTWRIIYRISESTVYVLSVIDSRQNVEDILYKKLMKY